MNFAPQVSGGLSATKSTTASAIVFAIFLIGGAAYIIATKSLGVSVLWATIGPLLFIFAYAILLGFARYLRLRDDQAGDNLYYLGFLYTLTSLGVSLWQFSMRGGAEAIVTNFGVAISSTILGVALRVIFGQMRQDPLEVERSARLQLAEAALRVRQELDATVFELSGFRRATQQSLSEGIVEVRKQIEFACTTVVEALKELPERSAAPLEGASKQTGEALKKLSATLSSGLEQSAVTLDREISGLASTATAVTEALRTVEAQLKAMQMPDGIIEIKLQPTIRSMTKALKDLSERLGAQMDQLQSAIGAATAARQGADRNSEVALAAQNKNLERIIVLLSSNEDSSRRLFESFLAAQERQRERDVEMVAILRKQGERRPDFQPASPETDRRGPHSGQGVSETQVSAGRWPWSRR